MKKIFIAILMICLSGASVTTIGGSECCAWGTGGDPPYLVITRKCCYWVESSCCEIGSGVAFCTTWYYSNGEYIGEESYYGDIYTVRDAVCGSIS